MMRSDCLATRKQWLPAMMPATIDGLFTVVRDLLLKKARTRYFQELKATAAELDGPTARLSVGQDSHDLHWELRGSFRDVRRGITAYPAG